MAQCKCGSFAVNDDPAKRLCDRCWRDATIADLRRRLEEIRIKSQLFHYGDKAIVMVPYEVWKLSEVNP